MGVELNAKHTHDHLVCGRRFPDILRCWCLTDNNHAGFLCTQQPYMEHLIERFQCPGVYTLSWKVQYSKVIQSTLAASCVINLLPLAARKSRCSTRSKNPLNPGHLLASCQYSCAQSICVDLIDIIGWPTWHKPVQQQQLVPSHGYLLSTTVCIFLRRWEQAFLLCAILALSRGPKENVVQGLAKPRTKWLCCSRHISSMLMLLGSQVFLQFDGC